MRQCRPGLLKHSYLLGMVILLASTTGLSWGYSRHPYYLPPSSQTQAATAPLPGQIPVTPENGAYPTHPGTLEPQPNVSVSPGTVVTSTTPEPTETPVTAVQSEETSGVSTPSPSETSAETPSQAYTVPTDLPLEQLYEKNEQKASKFTSKTYLLKVFGLLALLLGGFYLFARYVFPQWMASKQQEPLIPFGTKSTTTGAPASPEKPGLLKNILPPRAGGIQPQILSRTRLSPTKEIHVIQIGDRRLVVGSTPQQMTLLTELPPESDGIASSDKTAVSLRQMHGSKVYQKYLDKPEVTRSSQVNAPLNAGIPEDEEIYVLEDYEDDFERLS